MAAVAAEAEQHTDPGAPQGRPGRKRQEHTADGLLRTGHWVIGGLVWRGRQARQSLLQMAVSWIPLSPFMNSLVLFYCTTPSCQASTLEHLIINSDLR